MIYEPEFVGWLNEKTGFAHYNNAKTEIICKCPWCESESTKQKGHLYISTENPLFNCFKCETTGIVTKLIRELNGKPKEFVFEKALEFKSDYSRKEFSVKSYKIEKQIPDNYKLKTRYLKGRLGSEVNIDDVPGLILNIEEFLRNNKIHIDDSTKKLLDYLQNSFLGFISCRGNSLVLRNVDSTSNFRYYKIQLGHDNFFKDFYGIKTGNSNGQVNTIVLCEGPFDLLVASSTSELKEIKDKSCLWAAVLGCGYDKIIPSVLDYCKITAANFVILSDSNKSENHYRRFKKNPSVLNLEIYWNKFGSDFGKKPINLVRV